MKWEQEPRGIRRSRAPALLKDEVRRKKYEMGTGTEGTKKFKNPRSAGERVYGLDEILNPPARFRMTGKRNSGTGFAEIPPVGRNDTIAGNQLLDYLNAHSDIVLQLSERD